jgi:hypothetical protein
VRLTAVIEGKALGLVALQRKVRYEVALEPRLTAACAAGAYTRPLFSST